MNRHAERSKHGRNRYDCGNRTVSPFAPRWHGGRNVKKKIATLLVTVAMAGALFAGSASAQDHFYHHDAHWWSIHRPAYGYRPAFGYGPGYAYRPVGHWQLIGGHWHWIR